MGLRSAQRADYDALGEVLFDAVRNSPGQYNRAQRAAWAPAALRGDDWHARLKAQHVILAETEDAIQGFMTLTPGGYVDLAYIRPASQGTGLFRRLYQAIETIAADHGLPQLTTHASIMARPAFLAMSFHVVRRETVELRGQVFERYEMEKWLSTRASSS